MTNYHQSGRPARRGTALALALCLPAFFLGGPAVDATEIFAQLRGALLDEQGLPAAGYQVGLKNTAGDLFLSAPTGADGHFELIQLPPDSYEMVCFDPQGVEFPLVSRKVTLQGGQVERVEIRVAPAASGQPPGRGGRAADISRRSKLRGWWSGRPLGTKIGIVAFGAFAAYELIDNDSTTTSVSPSSP